MNMDETIAIVKAVLLDYRIIGVVVAALLYISIVNYVVRYKKKPPKIRKMVVSAPKPEEQNASDGSQEGEGNAEESSSGEEETVG